MKCLSKVSCIQYIISCWQYLESSYTMWERHLLVSEMYILSQILAVFTLLCSTMRSTDFLCILPVFCLAMVQSLWRLATMEGTLWNHEIKRHISYCCFFFLTFLHSNPATKYAWDHKDKLLNDKDFLRYSVINDPFYFKTIWITGNFLIFLLNWL